MRSIAMEHRNPAVRRTRRDARRVIDGLLALADIPIDGARRWDIRVHHPEFFRRVPGHGSLGSGESYMDGDHAEWDASHAASSSVK